MSNQPPSDHWLKLLSDIGVPLPPEPEPQPAAEAPPIASPAVPEAGDEMQPAPQGLAAQFEADLGVEPVRAVAPPPARAAKPAAVERPRVTPNWDRLADELGVPPEARSAAPAEPAHTEPAAP